MKGVIMFQFFKKTILFSSFLTIIILPNLTFANAINNTIVPENNLWEEDQFFLIENITEETFNNIIKVFHEVYDPEATAHNETLTFNAKWASSEVNARSIRNNGVVTIHLYGGLARRKEMTADAFALVICHELGHAYGGEPYFIEASQLSAEGQADYYGAKNCLNKILPKLPNHPQQLLKTNYTQKICAEQFGNNSPDFDLCLRKLSSGISLGKFFATIDQLTNKEPSYETPEKRVVSETILYYPHTQCRIDTYFNGIFNLARPTCWYKATN